MQNVWFSVGILAIPRLGKSKKTIIKMTTYFISDIHLGHNKDFIYKTRGFDSIENHDSHFMKMWADTITYDDDVCLVGDFMMGGNKLSRALDFFRRMPFQAINWYLGNHDPKYSKFVELEQFKPIVEDEGIMFFRDGLRLKQVSIFDFDNQLNTLWDYDMGEVLIGHLPYAGSTHKTAEVDPRESLYPFPTDKGLPRLHGHTHRVSTSSRGINGGLQIHVGIDAWSRFVTLEEIQDVLKRSS